MPICRNCGVEIEENLDRCPLCSYPSREVPAKGWPFHRPEEAEPAGRMNAKDRKQSHDREESAVPLESAGPLETEGQLKSAERDDRVRLLFAEVTGFIALAGGVVVFAVDFAYGMAVTWSRFPLAAIGFVWILMSIPCWLRRRIYLIICAETCNMILFLFLLDAFTPDNLWFMSLALPITAGLGTALLLTTGCIRRFRLSVLGSISMVLIAMGLWILWIEMLINRFLDGRVYVSWSLIAAASVVPIIAFLFNFDWRLKKHGSNLKKHFHV